MKCQDLSWGGPGMAASPTADLRCPIWASGTRSRIIRQASYTMVEGSNCIVLTTLPMLIFSERATMVAAGLSPLLRHLLEETDGLALTAGPSGVLPPPPPLRQRLCSPKARTQLLAARKSCTSHWRAHEGGPTFQTCADPGVSSQSWDPCLSVPMSQSRFCSPAGATVAGTQQRCCQ